MSYDNYFYYLSSNKNKQDWRSDFVCTIVALLMLLLGLIGNGVLRLS